MQNSGGDSQSHVNDLEAKEIAFETNASQSLMDLGNQIRLKHLFSHKQLPLSSNQKTNFILQNIRDIREKRASKMSGKHSPRNMSYERNSNLKGLKTAKNRLSNKSSQIDKFRQPRSNSIATDNIYMRSLNQTASVAAILDSHSRQKKQLLEGHGSDLKASINTL